MMKHARILLLIFLTACSLQPETPAPSSLGGAPSPTPLPAPTAISRTAFRPVPLGRTPPVGGLYVDVASSLGPVGPYVFGSNYGPWVAVPTEMLQAAYDSGVTIFRFPAGSWGDQNDLKDYHIDPFMSFIVRVGATASLTARLKGSTPEKAAALVRYVNLEKKYNIRYWSIGNEPGLYAKELNEDYDTERFNEEWRAFALAMKAVDPTIKLVGPEIHQFSYDPHDTNYGPWDVYDSSGRSWMDEFLKANGDLVDIISFHRYPFPLTTASPPVTIEDLRQNTQDWDKIIVHLRNLIHEIAGRDLPIAVTEVNSHNTKAVGGAATPDSHYNAIWWADVLGRLIRNGVFMVNHWMLTSQGGYGGWGLIGRGELRPSYYVYQMYKRFGTELLYAASDDPNVSVFAARRSDGAITLVIVNLASEPVEKTLALDGLSAAAAETWLFDVAHKAEQVPPTPLAGPLKLPAESMTLLVVK